MAGCNNDSSAPSNNASVVLFGEFILENNSTPVALIKVLKKVQMVKFKDNLQFLGPKLE